MTDKQLREIAERVERDKPVWIMGSAEASMAGRFDTWQAMHCTEAGMVYADRQDLLARLQEFEDVLNWHGITKARDGSDLWGEDYYG